MTNSETSQLLIEKLENLPYEKINQEESKNLIQLLKLALRQDQTNSAALVQNMYEGVAQCRIICDSKGEPNDFLILSVNPAFEMQTGISEKQAVGKTILEIFPDAEKFWIKFYGDVALTQQPNTIKEYNHNTKRHYISSAYSSIKGEFTMLFKDITERVELAKANEELEKAKQYDAIILDNMGAAFLYCEIICDDHNKPIDYRFLKVNAAFESHTGIKSKDILGKTALEFSPDVEKSWITVYGEVALTQKSKSFIKFNHNTNRYFQVNAFSPVKGRFAVFLTDITDEELKRLELEKAHLKAAENDKQKSALLSNMQEAFSHCQVICDDQNKPIDYRFLYANAAFETQTGIKVDTIKGKTILELFPDIEQSWIDIFGKVAITTKPKSFVKYNHNTNRYYQVNSFSPIKGEFAVFLRDVTDQETKRIELENAYKKAEENDKLKSAFLANMSHEVRTPMNAILGFSSLLEDEAVTEADKKLCLKQIKSSGNRLLTIISDIVDISKIDAKQQKLVFQDCDLNQLFEELFNRYSVLNANKNITIHVKKGHADEPFNIKTDRIRLDQILSNLIENALKYTLKGEVVFGYLLKDNNLQFYVKDTGIGIKKKNQKIVFDRFGQVADEARTVSSGTGLGLPIAQGLIKLFDGTIWLESKPKKGSTFYFTIPYIPVQIEPVDQHKQTILIAEDEDANFQLLNIWLSDRYNIIRASNGFEAIHLYEKFDAIELILMDIRMPYLDGIEATKEIRKKNTNIPIIAHTAFAMNEEAEVIKKAGCNQVLIKPITKDKLLEVLAEFKVLI